MNDDLFSMLSGQPEPLPGVWTLGAQSAPPRPVKWCSVSARTFALAVALAEHATGRRPGPLDARLSADANTLAGPAVAEAVALGAANLAGDLDGAQIARSKCSALYELLSGIAAEATGRVRLDARQGMHAGGMRAALAKAIRSSEGPIDRAELRALADEESGGALDARFLFA